MEWNKCDFSQILLYKLGIFVRTVVLENSRQLSTIGIVKMGGMCSETDAGVCLLFWWYTNAPWAKRLQASLWGASEDLNDSMSATMLKTDASDPWEWQSVCQLGLTEMTGRSEDVHSGSRNFPSEISPLGVYGFKDGSHTETKIATEISSICLNVYLYAATLLPCSAVYHKAHVLVQLCSIMHIPLYSYVQ